MIDERTRFKDGLDEDDPAGPGSDLKGWCRDGAGGYVREVEALEETGRDGAGGAGGGGADLGLCHLGWESGPFEGRWLELECRFDGMRLRLSQCREDD